MMLKTSSGLAALTNKITVGQPAATHFVVSAPTNAAAGTAFDFTVSAVDSAGNPLSGYTGMVAFSSTDPYATFSPSNYTFLPSDHGTKTFSGGAVLKAAGSQTVTATDGSNSGSSGR
jgi:hypothetical protein